MSQKAGKLSEMTLEELWQLFPKFFPDRVLFFGETWV